MKFSSFSLFILTLFIIPSISLAFSGAGAGTSQSPFIITSCVQLQEINDSLNSYYSLGNDIDCHMTKNWNEGKGFDPIGGDEFYSNSNFAFSGVLLGSGHSINGLYFNNGDSGYVGLFSYTNGAIIENLDLVDFNIVNGYKMGGLVSNAKFSTINNVKVSGSIGYYMYSPRSAGFTYYSWIYAGGIANTIYNSKISNSTSKVDFIGGDYSSIGGIVEQAFDSIIINSDNNHFINPVYYDPSSGKTIVDSYFVGGIVSTATRTSIISCVNRGSIISNLNTDGSADGGVGGIASYIIDSTINDSINFADLNASFGANYGGIVAKAKTSFITNSTNYGDLNEGIASIGGIAGYLNQSVVTNSNNFGDIKSFNWNRGTGVGGIVGYSWKAVIQNVSNRGNLDYNGDDGLGGILGFGNYTILKNCVNDGNIFGYRNVDYIGGIVGYFNDSNISDCNNSGWIFYGNAEIGGVGGTLIDSVAKRVFNSGRIYPFSEWMQKDGWFVGGLFGRVFYGIITDSNNYGDVRGSYYTGGLVGTAGNSLDISNSHNKGYVSGRERTSGVFQANWGEFRMNNVTTLYGVTNSNRPTDEAYNPYCDYLLSGGNSDFIDTYDCDALNNICPSKNCDFEIYFRHCGADSLYNHSSQWLSVCYLNNKKEYLEQRGYFGNLGSSGLCLGPIFGNTTEYYALLTVPDLLENSFVGLIDGNNSRGCQNWCSSSEYVDDIAGLLPICRSRSSGTKYCIGGGFLNSEIYANDNVGLTVDVRKTLTTSNTSAKCEYHCIDGYKLVGGECVQENVCVNNDGKCVSPCNSLNDSDCPPCGLADLTCPWYCNSFNDPDCPPTCLNSGACSLNSDCCSNNCQGGFCGSEIIPSYNCIGSIDSNALIVEGDDLDLIENVNKVLIESVSSNTLGKCEYYCRPGFEKGSGVDENKCLLIYGYYSGCDESNLAEGWLIYPGDYNDLTILDNITPILSESDTSKKCEYYCDSSLGLVMRNGSCVPQFATEGICGDANRIYYLNEEFPGWGELCKAGSALPNSGFNLGNVEGDFVKWLCTARDVNANCRATRSEANIFDVNAILKFSVNNINGEIVGSVSCSKETKADLILVDEKGNNIEFSPKIVNCSYSPNSFEINPSIDLNEGVFYSIRASIKENSPDCSICSKTVLFTPRKVKDEKIPDNSFTLVIIILLLVINILIRKTN